MNSGAAQFCPRHKFGFGFFFTRVWDPNSGDFGALPFIYGTLVTAVVSLIIAVPLGIGAAIFLAELAPARVSDTLQFFIDLLAAVPSVIYGLLGVFIVIPMMREYIQPALNNTLGFLPFFTGPAYGIGFLTAGIVLAIMVIPYIISVSREVLLSVPRDQREAALALGSTRWESTWKVVVPFARTGIMGSIFLALARALGETMAVTMVIGNTPTISASLFSPGYSIAAVIANEFTEATGDLYLQVSDRARPRPLSPHLHPQRPGPHPDRRHLATRRRTLMSPRLRWRKFVSGFMLTMTGLCALVAVSVLFFILGYLVYHGGTSINWNFFTKLPAPVGETGGGMANAIVGSAKLLLLATLIGVPIGFLGAIYLAEFSTGPIAFVVRYAADLLNGVPSIVIGIFAYTLVVLPFKHFSTLAGGVALGVMMIPITLRSTEDFMRAVPNTLREGAMALGASKWKTIATVIVPAAYRGILTAVLLAFARVAGETAPLLFTAFGNRYWSPGWNQPIESLPHMVYIYAISPYEDWQRQAWAAGLVLLGLILIVNILARTILARGVSVPRS